MGVVPVKTGSIQLDGAAITKDTPYERVRSGDGLVAPPGRDEQYAEPGEQQYQAGQRGRTAPAGRRWAEGWRWIWLLLGPAHFFRHKVMLLIRS